jgi:hypothetical protein
LENELMNRRLSVEARRRILTPFGTGARPVVCDRNGWASRFYIPRNAFSFFLAALSAAFFFVRPSATRAADISQDIRTADDATPYKATIDANIQSQVTSILQDDPIQSARARDSLVDEVRGLIPPSASFLDLYCSELQSQFAPLTAPTASIRVRLNAAIVVARVAATAKDANLAQLVIAELNDQNEAVVLWGLKAAHDVIPPALNVQTLKASLISAVIKAAQRLTTGPIISAAYNALSPTDPSTPLASLIDPVQTLLAWRLTQYNNAVPSEPPDDAVAIGFLTQRSAWLTETPPQQRRTVQLAVDLLGAATSSLSMAQQDDKDELTLLLRKMGDAIFAFGITTADPSLRTAAGPLRTVDQRPQSSSPVQAAALAVSGLAAKYPGLRIPKPFSAAASAPAVAPAPAPAINTTP